MITFPNAKINLGLNVVERRPDGYHNLETIFYPVPLQDILEVTTFDEAPMMEVPEGADVVLHTGGIAVAGGAEDNLVVRAYRQLQRDFSLPPVHIHLFKHIPSGAGLGGGSSDATFMMRLLRDKFSLPVTDEDLEERSALLGADCAFFVRNSPSFATGIGNVFTPLPALSLKGYYFVLVKPDVFVSTRDAFALIQPNRPNHSLTKIAALPVEEWREAGMVNDFETSVFAKFPEIGRIKEQLYAMGAIYASMSGSGSSLFGLFKEMPVSDVGQLDTHFPGSFVWCCQLTV